MIVCCEPYYFSGLSQRMIYALLVQMVASGEKSSIKLQLNTI